MEQYVDGDRRAFALLHRMIEPKLRGFLMNLVRNPAVVDDLLQVALLKAHMARDRFELQGGDPDGAVQAWYFAIARNVAMDHLRSEYRTQRRLGRQAASASESMAEVADEAPNIEDLGAQNEEERHIVEQVRAAIAQLPESQREVVELHKLRGLSMAEVAKRLEVREGAVRVRAHRAYKALARLLVPNRKRAG